MVGPRRGRVELSYRPHIECVSLVDEGGVRKASLSNVTNVHMTGIYELPVVVCLHIAY